jgi:hypothetical protein
LAHALGANTAAAASSTPAAVVASTPSLLPLSGSAGLLVSMRGGVPAQRALLQCSMVVADVSKC